jgi:hypothetical protein
MKQTQAMWAAAVERNKAFVMLSDMLTSLPTKSKRKPNPNSDTKAKKARSDPEPGGMKRKADEEPAGGWAAFFDTSRAGRPAGKRGSLLLPEGGPSEPQPGVAAAIDDGLFK